MRLSRYFLPTLKEAPKEAEIVSHRLMLRAGLVHQESSGIYSWLPLGCAVLKKIENIVREEQNRAGFLECLMPTIQPSDLWRASGRYDAYGKEMLRIRDRHDREMLYGPTNEEMVTGIFRSVARSYRDVPALLYHIQWKFRDELRPRFGVMRGREFLMKDAYSFDIDPDRARNSYYRQFVTYLRTFDRLGLKCVPVSADTGPIGGDLSHEFVVLSETGESSVFCDRAILEQAIPRGEVCSDSELEKVFRDWTDTYASMEEKHDPQRFESEVSEENRVVTKGIEVGHIFYFGRKYSEALGASLQTSDGSSVFAEMGSYGIGISRLVGAIIESSHDQEGIIWPESVAPFQVGIVNIKQGDRATDEACEDLYERMCNAGLEVLYDDREERAGAKFSRMDLIGLPWQCIVGPRGISEKKVELKHRASGTRTMFSPEEIVSKLVSQASE